MSFLCWAYTKYFHSPRLKTESLLVNLGVLPESQRAPVVSIVKFKVVICAVSDRSLPSLGLAITSNVFDIIASRSDVTQSTTYR